MKTAVITEKHKVEIREAPRPQLKAHEVLIQVEYAGICGSDIHLFHNEHPFRKPPMIPGHEVSGVVVEAGASVTKHKSGDRVVVNHAIPCGKCRFCQAGQINICPTKIVAGSGKMMGFFAEYINVPESTLFKIADGISLESAALAEPLSIGFHIMRRLEHAGKGPVAILGTGTIGLLALIAARSLGYREIYCIDPIDYNLEVALKLGAARVFNPLKVNAAEEIMKCTGSSGVNATVVTAAAKGIITDACGMTSLSGTVIMLPMTSKILEGNFYRLVAGEQALIGCRGIVQGDFENAAELINNGFDFSPLITHILPMSQSQYGFDVMVSRPEPVIKVLVQPGR
ncbi:zinc-binding dehydrogenase [Paenibacillus sp. S150]|uniref:zinc-dependent alcohol dehydrogenase n=1 Tax=Paenibacillus sp. S150 TaxID=2749826 RepID=UPI001C56A886|nr:alcohol dehydrogenase catalytic domain-containing protein [Paenibacillus sp. S150]MBW4081217.1 alcohol dehydrogenase catalytic domain-containing protein [Paenibacillus sp. S150]